MKWSLGRLARLTLLQSLFFVVGAGAGAGAAGFTIEESCANNGSTDANARESVINFFILFSNDCQKYLSQG
ncbi:hypothetical protein A3860_14130 [Niastella vici]|uniref:Uncharacterized protein n=1 Tax=Niastella vici TaxID=1703345 RepID=A0A1V9G521_9BACT|nr:hypothetical protein A3860_14130 [Niastella vici]